MLNPDLRYLATYCSYPDGCIHLDDWLVESQLVLLHSVRIVFFNIANLLVGLCHILCSACHGHILRSFSLLVLSLRLGFPGFADSWFLGPVLILLQVVSMQQGLYMFLYFHSIGDDCIISWWKWWTILVMKIMYHIPKDPYGIAKAKFLETTTSSGLTVAGTLGHRAVLVGLGRLSTGFCCGISWQKPGKKHEQKHLHPFAYWNGRANCGMKKTNLWPSQRVESPSEVPNYGSEWVPSCLVTKMFIQLVIF